VFLPCESRVASLCGTFGFGLDAVSPFLLQRERERERGDEERAGDFPRSFWGCSAESERLGGWISQQMHQDLGRNA